MEQGTELKVVAFGVIEHSGDKVDVVGHDSQGMQEVLLAVMMQACIEHKLFLVIR